MNVPIFVTTQREVTVMDVVFVAINQTHIIEIDIVAFLFYYEKLTRMQDDTFNIADIFSIQY